MSIIFCVSDELDTENMVCLLPSNRILFLVRVSIAPS
jgi:hypothetical protein